MAERTFRSNHTDVVTPSMAPRTRDRRRTIVAVPIALTALVSMVFGVQGTPGAHAADTSRGDRTLKTKTFATSAQRSLQHVTAMVFREGKYTVAVGDTVSEIAANAGISTAELLAANGLSWKTLIFADQQLDIPRSTSGSSVPTMSPAITRHRVSPGDTLEMIGRTYGVQPRALMTANGLDRSSRLIVGQRLVVPDAGVMGGLPAESVA
ncbi:MAG: LysM peptidoglycan-binding domain-containing protein [Actinomycetales bacterium]|nr:LysM peptidoglycan-binding domain-containing protein [Actinomycetales bacterium]